MKKKCPICKIEKELSEFDRYFSKARNKYRTQNYCRECSKPEKAKRSADYFKSHKAERLKYAKNYRIKNKDKIKPKKLAFKKKYIEQLQDCYVAGELAKRCKSTVKDVRKIPELVNAYRTKLKLSRKIKYTKNEK